MRYKEYKKVDIPWLNEVPSHWEIVRNKNLFKHKKNIIGNESESAQLLSLTTKGIKKINIEDSKGKTPMSYDTYQRVCKDDLVICLFDLDVSAVFSDVSKYYGMISPAYQVFESDIVHMNYYKYIFDKIFQDRSYKLHSKSLRYTITPDNFLMLDMIVPPKEEQEQIAKFLDWKINEIDGLIRGYRNKIQYINLIKSQLIANEYMKPDEKIRLKMLLKNDMEYGLNISGDISGDFRYVRITDIDKNGNLKKTAQQFVSNFDKKYILNKGDILFARSGATVGKTYYYKESDGNCAYAGYLIRAIVNKDLVYPEYIYYFTQSEIYEEWKNSIFIQSTIQNINAEKYSNLLIPMFNKEVQEKVIKNCELIINFIDKIEKNQVQQINNLQQLKQSLISDVVMGKIDVRNVVIPEYDKVSDIEDDVILEESFNEEV